MGREVLTRGYIAGIGFMAVLLASVSTWLWPLALEMQRIWLLPVLVIMVSLAARFPFKVSPQGDATLVTVPLFMAALLLHPLEAGLVGIVGTAISERLLKAPPRVMAYNSGVSGLVGVLAGTVFWGLRPEAAAVFSPGVVLAAALAGLVLHVSDLSLLFGMITIVKGRNVLQRWREAWAFEAVQEGSLLIMGLVGAQLVMFAWWWALILVVPFVVAYYGFRRSVEETSHKTRLAEELEQKLRELEEAQAQLIQSAKLATVGTLAAGVAHEINNPLTIITGRAELFLARLQKSREYAASDKALQDIQDIYKMGMRISTIVNQLLAYSRRSDHLAEVRLDKVMEDSLTFLQGKLEKKGVNVVRELQPMPAVQGVANQLQQVFVNLVGNALDATPAWGTVTLGCYVQDGMAVAYVRDTGIGIPDELKERIFEPFFTTKEVGKGTGLGLFICHKIIADHQGEITFESKQGEGTTFWVKFLLAVPESQYVVSMPTAVAS